MRIIFLFSIVLGLFSCGVKTSTPGMTDDDHNSMNSLDWAGVYLGNAPCSNCDGIETVIRLYSDSTFNKEVRYKGLSPEIIKSAGNFTWNSEGNAITLYSSAGNTTYKVGENKLLQLDLSGETISANLADKYTFKKSDDIRDIYWKLIELNGKPEQLTPQVKERHLIITSQGTVVGNSGCNSFSGRYELSEGNRIRFSPIAATKMACLEVKDEHEFFRIFEISDSYAIRNDTLSLNKSKMAPLAKFVAVYLR